MPALPASPPAPPSATSAPAHTPSAPTPAQLLRLEAARTGIGQRREAVQPVRSAIAAQLRPCPPSGLLLRAVGVRGTPADRLLPKRRHEAAATLARIWVEVERPIRPMALSH